MTGDPAPSYASGGLTLFANGGVVPVTLGADECVLAPGPATFTLRCVRADHPTETSECRTRQTWPDARSVLDRINQLGEGKA